MKVDRAPLACGIRCYLTRSGGFQTADQIKRPSGETAAPCYMSIFPRCFFNSLRLRFDSRIRLFNLAGRGDFRRRSLERNARFAARSASRCFPIAARKRARAIRRFITCERESCTVTLTPLGR